MAAENIYNTSRTRTLLIMTASMLLIGITVAIYSFSKNNDPKAVAPAPKLPSSIVITPGAKSSEKYVELQQNANLLGTKKAEEQGKTFIPTIINNNQQNNTDSNFKKELTNILEEKKNNNNNDSERLSKQLAMLLEDLNKQNNSTDDLLKVLMELQNQGYNIEDLENLLKKLSTDGYKTNELYKLLNKLKQQCYPIYDVEKLLKRLLAEGNNNPAIVNKILDQLLKDRVKGLEDLLKKLQNSDYNKEDPEKLLKKLLTEGYKADELAKLFKKLQQQGYPIDDVEKLLKKLSAEGYNPALAKKILDELLKANSKPMEDAEKLLKQLLANGAKADDLNEVLKQLLADGQKADDLEKVLKKLLTEGYNPALIQKMLDQLAKARLDVDALNEQMKANNELKNKLANILNNSNISDPNASKNPSTNTSNTPDTDASKLEKQYQDLLRKQEEKFNAAESARKLKERNLVSYETRKKDIEAMIANMNAQADLMNKNLSKVPAQTFVKGEEKKQNTESINGSSINSNLNSKKKFNKNDIIIKSGTILFGVIDTKVNSDEPGPVLAKIVHGSLKGTTLIGNIQNNSNKFAEGLSINFQTANIPDKIKSYSISAMAIDPDTARTAIASDVDHHYLLRWGSIFASSFLKGYSKSVASAGNTVQQTINPLTGTTNVTTTANPLTSQKSQIYQGLSDVASAWSSNVSNLSDRAPTITIDSGTSIGIMLTADFFVPANDDLSAEQDQLTTGSNNPITMVNPDLGVKSNSPQPAQVSLNNNNTTDNKNLNATSNNNQNLTEDGANTRR